MPAIQQLRYLIALSDTLSFSRAAEICRVSQPTLSVQIRQLEEKLGVTLIERTRARVIVTPIGAEITAQARLIMGHVGDIRSLARGARDEELPAELKIGVERTLGAYVLSVAMGDVRSAFPDTRLSVREDSSDGLLRQLSDASFDVILRAEALPPSGFDGQTLITEPLQLVVPSDHPLAQGLEVQPADLVGARVLSFGGPSALQEQIRALCHDAQATLVRDYEGTSLDTLRQMVAIGMGVALLPALYIHSEVMREARVCARPLSAPPYRPVTMVWRKNAVSRQGYKRLAEIMAHSLAPWNWPAPEAAREAPQPRATLAR